MHESRRRLRRHARWAVLLGLALVTSACNSGGGDGGRQVTIASTDFTENEIVARMYALVLEQAGFEVEEQYQLGARAVVLAALEEGDVDIYPEYVGTALEELNGGAGEATADTAATLELLRAEFEELGAQVLEPADAEDKNGLVVTGETAEELGVATTSDLVPQAGELTFGGPPECPERPLCAPGYEETYGLTFAEFVPLDAGGPLTVAALEGGDIDVALLFTTDGIIAANDWVLLEDDMGLQPAENLVPVVRDDALNEDVTRLLNGVSGVLTTEALTELNRRVNADAEDPQTVAADFLVAEGLIEEG